MTDFQWLAVAVVTALSGARFATRNMGLIPTLCPISGHHHDPGRSWPTVDVFFCLGSVLS